MNKEKDVINLKDSARSSTWSPTMNLQWKRTVVFDDFSRTQKDELQQLWTGNLGEQEWRPIEFVE